MLTKVRLEVARTKEHPNGSSAQGYEFTVPLNSEGRIDNDAFRSIKERCRVRRFRLWENDEVGHLVRKPGGSWAFHYDIVSDAEGDEAGYRFGDHRFRLGDYVSVEEDGEFIPYRVVQTTEQP